MNIIVIGGTRGIGKEIVKLISEDKDNQVMATGRNEDSLRDLVQSSRHDNVSSAWIDLSAFDGQKESFKEQVYGCFSKIDIMINSAGALTVKEFLKTGEHEARQMMETNFFGPASVIRLLAPLMARGSHIVNISSMGGFQGSSKYGGLSYYSASKAALACLSECLSGEFRDAGISVNCLALGSVQTEMFENAFPGARAQVNAREMAEFIVGFALNGHKFFNGKVLPVAISNP